MYGLWVLMCLLPITRCLDVCSKNTELEESGQLSSPRHPSPAPAGSHICHCTLQMDSASLKKVEHSEPGDWRLKVTARQVVLGCDQNLNVHIANDQLLDLPEDAGEENCTSSVKMSPFQIGLISPRDQLHVTYKSHTNQPGGRFALYFETINRDNGIRNLPKVKIECGGNEIVTTSTTVSTSEVTKHNTNKAGAVEHVPTPLRPSDEQETRDSQKTFVLVGVICGILFALLLLGVAILLHKRRTREKCAKKQNADSEKQYCALGNDDTWEKHSSLDKRKRETQTSESDERDSAYRSHNSSHCSLTDSHQHSPTSSAGYCDEAGVKEDKSDKQHTQRSSIPDRSRGHSAPHKITAKNFDPLLRRSSVELDDRTLQSNSTSGSDAAQKLLNRHSKISTV